MLLQHRLVGINGSCKLLFLLFFFFFFLFQCSFTCGSGIRTRSVRCLDEDGVIARDCNSNKPQPYEFCNQVNCSTSGKFSNYMLLPDFLPILYLHTSILFTLTELHSHSRGWAKLCLIQASPFYSPKLCIVTVQEGLSHVYPKRDSFTYVPR